LPRFRYDRLMRFGWKVLIPWGLLWILITGAVVVLPDVYGRERFIRWVLIVAAITVAMSFVSSLFGRKPEEAARGGSGR
jgi:NADH-quinone oxidoreductase subunit H